MANTVKTQESILLNALKRGKSFFTSKTDKDMTAIASYYKKRIKTKRLLAIDPHSGKVQKLTKVTIVS